MPSDQSAPHAAPMEGGGAYNRGGLVQAAHAGSVLPLLEAAVRRVPVDPTGAPLVLADYGCSQGANSLAPLHAAIAALRERVGSERPISVVHNDQPGNDFSSLFRLLEDDPGSYLRDDANVFPSAVGRSYFRRVLPPGSVSFGWSSMAVHWLSRAPATVPDSWHPAFTAVASVREAYERQSAEDWRTFLTHRAEELRPGGRLLVSMLGVSDDGAPGYEPMVRHMHAERDAMRADGALSAEQGARLFVPALGRSRTAVLAPFGAEGRFAGLAVEHVEVAPAPDPIWHAFSGNGDAAAFGKRWAAMFRVTIAPSLAAALDPADRAGFLDRLEAGLAARYAAAPEPMPMWVARVVLARTDD